MSKELKQEYEDKLYIYLKALRNWIEYMKDEKQQNADKLGSEINKLKQQIRKKRVIEKILSTPELKAKESRKEKYDNIIHSLKKLEDNCNAISNMMEFNLGKLTTNIGNTNWTIKSNLEMIGAELSKELQLKISNQVNLPIFNNEQQIEKYVDDSKKLLNQLKVDLKYFHTYKIPWDVYQGKEYSSPILGNPISVISNIGFFKERILNETINLNFNDNKLQIDFNRVMGIYSVNIDELFNNLKHNIGSLDKNTQYVVKNYKTLKEQYIEYKKLEVLQGIINATIEHIEEKDLKRDFKELLDTLGKVSLEFKEKSDKLAKILRECEFEKTVKNVYHEQKQLADKKAQAEFLISRYVELSQQYRQAFNNNETEKAFKIKQEMDEIYEKASPEDRKKMTTNAQFQKYVSEDKETEVEREQTPMERLMELASYELKQNPPIDHVEEVFNGDVRTHYFDNSDAKINMVKEWQKISKMSPVQRGLYLNGKISFKSEDDLTPDEIAYYNTYYSDSALPYVKDCKALEKQEENQKKVNSIYRDYIRAKVSGYKKSFGSYVQEKAQVIGLNPEELTNKMIKDAVEIGEGRNR